MCVNVDSERFTLIDSRDVFTQNDSREMTEARSEEPESNLRNADASTTLSPRQSGLGKDPGDPNAPVQKASYIFRAPVLRRAIQSRNICVR